MLQVLRPWRGVRTQKRLSVAALRSPTDIVARTPGAALRSSMRRWDLVDLVTLDPCGTL